MIKAMNLRVYGVLINDKNQVLLSDERIYYNNLAVTKFPGGGLELGEGTIDCIKRECMEEMGIQVAVTEHIYTTDFFQQSAFNPEHQIISIYYLLKSLQPLDVPVNNGPAMYPEKVSEIFRFVDKDYFNEDLMTLPIDKIAATIVKEKLSAL